MGHSEDEREQGCLPEDIRAWESVAAFDGVGSVILLSLPRIFAFLKTNA